MDMMDNASALPTCPQRNNKRRQWFKNGPKSPTRLPEDAFLIMVLQPLFMGRWYALRRAQAIRAIEKLHGTRVITMIHRQPLRLCRFATHRSGGCSDDHCWRLWRDQGSRPDLRLVH
jgi:Serine dehydrogenase proteinase